MKILEFHKRIHNIMKIKEFLLKIQNIESHKIPNENHETIMKII